MQDLYLQAVAYGDYFFPKKFEFVSLYSFICLQAVYQLSGPVCRVAALRILLLTFTSLFVIDFLSIRKVTRKMVPIMGRASS